MSDLVGLKQAMLTWLASLQGKHCLLVQHLQGQTGDLSAVEAVFTATGQYPAGIGGNYLNDDNQLTTLDYDDVNPALIAWWNAGGVVTLFGATPNPSGGGQGATSVNIANALSAGTPENAAFQGFMQTFGQGLLQLQAAGVMVFMRYLPEMNGNWNWWGETNVNAAQFGQLWRMWDDYNTKTLGLQNLIRVYSSNGGDLSRYPGDDYVDAVGFDCYSDNPGADALSSYQAFATPNPAVGYAANKPIAYTEFGPGSPSLGDPNFDETILIAALKGPLKNCVWCEQWWERWAMNTVQNIAQALHDPWVLNRAALGRPSAAAPPVVTPPPAVLTQALVQGQIAAAQATLALAGSVLAEAATQISAAETALAALLP